MGKDLYQNFSHLSQSQILNLDFRIRVRDLGAAISIMAIHGGRIEPNTSEIARSIAGDTYNYYCFEGIKREGNHVLHLTSHHFDEPQGLDLARRSKVVVAIHACRDQDEIIYPGGRFKALTDHIGRHLSDAGIRVSKERNAFPGMRPDNLCNQGQLKMGIQLEVSRGLRDQPEKISLLSNAVNLALSTFKFY